MENTNTVSRRTRTKRPVTSVFPDKKAYVFIKETNKRIRRGRRGTLERKGISEKWRTYHIGDMFYGYVKTRIEFTRGGAAKKTKIYITTKSAIRGGVDIPLSSLRNATNAEIEQAAQRKISDLKIIDAAKSLNETTKKVIDTINKLAEVEGIEPAKVKVSDVKETIKQEKAGALDWETIKPVAKIAGVILIVVIGLKIFKVI